MILFKITRLIEITFLSYLYLHPLRYRIHSWRPRNKRIRRTLPIPKRYNYVHFKRENFQICRAKSVGHDPPREDEGFLSDPFAGTRTKKRCLPRRMAKKQGRVDVTGKPRRKKRMSAGHEVRLERLFMCRHVSASSEGKQKGVGRYG